MKNTLDDISKATSEIPKLVDVLVEREISRRINESPSLQNKLCLNSFERQVFSQNGEDGIIEEIFNRIGTTNKFFVEFGVGDGLENNSIYLLNKGWNGFWIEGSSESVNTIKKSHKFFIDRNSLDISESFITAENIEQLFKDADVPEEFDLLSIDIDRNDYWVWKNIKNYHPRVVVIEYNALFPPGVDWIISYKADEVWDRTTYSNASLSSIEALAKEKGYVLVGCNFTGVNAFFVREDLVGSQKFLEPFTSEIHYHTPKYNMVRRFGRERGIGEFIQ